MTAVQPPHPPAVNGLKTESLLVDRTDAVVTLTLNPGLDLTYTLTESMVGEVDVHRATTATLEASGKGVNVSRALHANGIDTVATPSRKLTSVKLLPSWLWYSTLKSSAKFVMWRSLRPSLS